MRRVLLLLLIVGITPAFAQQAPATLHPGGDAARLDRADGPLSEAAAKSPANAVIQDRLGDVRFQRCRFAETVVARERALAGDAESVDRADIEKKLRDARLRPKR